MTATALTIATRARLLTPAQVAELTGLAVGTLAKLRLRGEGAPFIKLGSAVRYHEDDVQAWLAAQPRRRSTSDVASSRARP